MVFPCERCRRRPAEFVCQSCGARVCSHCYDPHYKLCATCMATKVQVQPPQPIFIIGRSELSIWMLSILLMFLGMVLIVTSIAFSAIPSGEVAFFFFIGPFPIGFGYGSNEALLFICIGVLLIMVILTVFSIYLIAKRR